MYCSNHVKIAISVKVTTLQSWAQRYFLECNYFQLTLQEIVTLTDKETCIRACIYSQTVVSAKPLDLGEPTPQLKSFKRALRKLLYDTLEKEDEYIEILMIFNKVVHEYVTSVLFFSSLSLQIVSKCCVNLSIHHVFVLSRHDQLPSYLRGKYAFALEAILTRKITSELNLQNGSRLCKGTTNYERKFCLRYHVQPFFAKFQKHLNEQMAQRNI